MMLNTIGLIDKLPALVTDRNVMAFLKMIRYCEGTAAPAGYSMLFGGKLFTGFADHPRQSFRFTDKLGRSLTTSAAGAYQFQRGTWDECKKALGLKDFMPDSQDKAAIYLIARRGALDLVKAGNVKGAINKLGNEWASLPSASIAQPRKSLTDCINVYKKNGGQVAV